MKPIIISFDCAEFDPIESWQFSDPSRVDIWINFTVGLDNSSGDNFQLRVITSELFRSKRSLEHYIVLDTFNWEQVMERVNSILQTCQGNDWKAICDKLSKHMYWEYEDYLAES